MQAMGQDHSLVVTRLVGNACGNVASILATRISLNDIGGVPRSYITKASNFYGLFCDVKIRLHFPLLRPQGNLVKVIGKEPLTDVNTGDFYKKVINH